MGEPAEDINSNLNLEPVETKLQEDVSQVSENKVGTDSVNTEISTQIVSTQLDQSDDEVVKHQKSDVELYNIYEKGVNQKKVPKEVMLSDFESEKNVNTTIKLCTDDSELSDDNYTRNRCLKAYAMPEGSDVEDQGLQPIIYQNHMANKAKSSSSLLYNLNKFITPKFSINNLHMMNNELMSYISAKSTAPSRAKQESGSSWDSLVNVLLTKNKGNESDKKKAVRAKRPNKPKDKNPSIEDLLTNNFGMPFNMRGVLNNVFSTSTSSKGKAR